MESVLSALRREPLWRFCSWVSLSCIFAGFGIIETVFIGILIMPLIEADVYVARGGFMLISHLMTLAIPWVILRNFSHNYGTAPPIHAILSMTAWFFLDDPAFLIVAFALIHLAIWAEVVGVYWQRKLA